MKYFRTIKKALFNIIWIGLTAGVLFILVGFFLSKKHEDKITEVAIEQVNQMLDTKISVDNVKISLFTKFPYVSVVFRNVIVWSPNHFDREAIEFEETDKLLQAEKIYLQFNLYQILFKKFNISRILIQNGEANLLVDKEGRTNYKIFKEKEGVEKLEGTSPKIQLQAFRMLNFSIKYHSLAKSIVSEAELKEITLKGNFSEEEFSLASSISMLLKTTSYEGVSYANNYELSIKSIVSVKEKAGTITKGIFSVNNMHFSTSGNFDFADVPYLEIQVLGRGLDITSLLNMAPEKTRSELPITIKGKADIAARVLGAISTTQSPEINAVYLLSLDNVSHKSLSLSNLQLKGKLLIPNDKLKKSSFSIEKYRIDDENNKLEGSLYLEDFSKPEVNFSISGYSDLLFINNQLSTSRLQDITGTVLPDLKVSTTLKSLKEFSIQNILNGNVSGRIGVSNTGFKIADDYRIANLNGYLSVNKNSWQGDFDLVFNDSKSHFKAKADYLLNYLFEDNKSLWIQADLQSDLFKTDLFIPDTKSADRSRKAFFLPQNIYAKLNLGLGRFEHKNFVMQSVSAMLNYSPGELEILNLSTNSMNGKLTGKATIQQAENGMFLLGSKSNLADINVKELFQSFDNFGQEVIMDKNLNGRLSGDFEFSINADSMFNIDMSSISMNSQLVINSGELIDFEPAQKLSGFVQLEELEHIKFSTITNTILIRDEVITIPEMEVTSSAFNIGVSGTHSFSKYFDYKIKINLNDLLAKKAKKSKLENDEHFVLEENGRRTSLYLSVKGTPEDYQLKYDKKEAVLNIKQDLKEEKTSIKKILNEEFGWFKRDSLINSSEKEDNGTKFIIDWGEQEDSVEVKKPRRKRRKKPTEKEEVLKIEWDEGDI